MLSGRFFRPLPDFILLYTFCSLFRNNLKSLPGKVKKESEKKVSMILKEFLEKKNQGKANKDVMMAVEEESAENPSRILGIVEKQLDK